MKRIPACLLLAALLFGCTTIHTDQTGGGAPEIASGAAAEAALAAAFKSVPERYRAQSLENLRSYYAYKQVREWLAATNGDEVKCVAFLFAYLPPVDYGALTPELIREHVECALRVRAEAPWREQITDELFYHYILPHRVSQEPCQAWRKLMHDELWPRVKDLPMQEAALEANRYAAEYAGFTQTNARDQGPLTTMLRGKGRCEELMILYICAARSIGIPARACSTPYWTFTDNNHAWCECFADGRWWFLGGAEPELHLDQGWFAGPASRAGLVVSTAYGDVIDSKEPVYRRATGVTFINSTPVYGDTCEVHASCDSEITGEVFVHIFNFGSLRVIGRFSRGGAIFFKDGPYMLTDTITLGRGDYILTAMSKEGPVAALARTWDDQAQTPDVKEHTLVKLTPEGWRQYVLGQSPAAEGDDPAPKDVHHWLRFPVGPRKSKGRAPVGATHGSPLQLTAEQKQALKAASQQRQRERWQWLKERSKLTPEDEKLIDSLPGDYPQRARAQLARCGANTPEVMSGIRHLKWHHYERLLHLAVILIESWDEKDCFEWTGLALFDSIEDRIGALFSAQENRIHREFLVPTRVRYEPTETNSPGSPVDVPWDAPLPEAPRAATKLTSENLKRAEPTFYGCPGNAWQTLRARRATLTDAATTLVTVLRSYRYPARLAPGNQWAEVYIDGQWLPAYPFEPENFGKVKEEAKAAYAPPGRLNLSLTRDGGAFPDAKEWRDFMLCRVSRGFVEPMEDVDWQVDGGGPCANLQPGDYVLFTGARSPRGDVCYRSAPVHIESNKTATVSADCTLVREELDTPDLLSRRLNAWPQVKVERAGKFYSLQQIVGDKTTLVVLLNTKQEPARRLLESLAPLKAELDQRGINVCAIYVGSEGREDYEKVAAEAGVSFSLYDDAQKTLLEELAIEEKDLPTVFMLTPMRDTLLWHGGYSTHVPLLVRAAMKWVK